MKRMLLLVLPLLASASVPGQVRLDRPLVLSGASDSLRRIDGLVKAQQADALITAKEALAGSYCWGVPSGASNFILLSTTPPVDAYTNGLTIRWIPHRVNTGPPRANVNNLGARRILRPDGLPAEQGALDPGKVVEIVFWDSTFFLTSRSRTDCPDGYASLNADICIQRNDSGSTDYFSAALQCRISGARLCTWAEYMSACDLVGGQLNGLFDDWEWIDDTSDHTHTSNQAGRFTCQSQRAVNADTSPNNIAPVRCCYRKP